MVSGRVWPPTTVLVAASLAMVACTTGGTGSPSATSEEGGASTVGVALQEWAVIIDAESVPAGEVTFEVTNDGPEDIHEFVVIKTELDVADLPTDADGAVDEGAEGLEVIDEIEDLPVGESQTLTLDLEAGGYGLICNVWDADEGEAHYQMGMRTPFTVGD